MGVIDDVAGQPPHRRVRRSYDQVADRYADELDAELVGKPLDRAMLDAFAELVAGQLMTDVDGAPVADIGCGPGQVGAYLAGRGRLGAAGGGRVIGIDLSPAMCHQGRQRHPEMAFAADAMAALPLADAALGGLVCFYAVIHLDRAARALAYAEFNRVLRPGGYALIAFHISDAQHPVGGENTISQWWERPVALTF